MFLRLLFLALACSLQASCEDDIPSAPLLASIDSEPSGIIDGCINVISGCYFEHDVDLVVPGPEALSVERILLKNNGRHSIFQISLSTPEWNFNDMQFISIHTHHKDDEGIHLYESSYHGDLGEDLYFEFESKRSKGHECPIDFAMLKEGHTNTSKGVIGAQTNIRSNSFRLFKKAEVSEISKSNGSLLKFKRHKRVFAGDDFDRYNSHFLEEEISPNYLKKNFTYDKNHELTSYSLSTWGNRTLSEVQRKEVATQDFREISYMSPDGRTVLYRFENKEDKKADKLPYSGRIQKNLQEVIRSDKPNHVYTYWPKSQLKSKLSPDYRFVSLDYYIDDDFYCKKGRPEFGRLKTLHAPLGSDRAPIQKYRFLYYLPEGGGGCAGVYDALNRKTDYGFNNRNRLTSVVKFDGSGTPYTSENLYWGQEDTHKEIELCARTFGLFNNPYKSFSKVYHYDVSGNVINESLSGNLTGQNETNTLLVDANGIQIPGTSDCLSKWHEYSHDKFHLLLKTTVGTRSIRNVYLPNTNLLSACYHADAGKTYLRHFYFYDDTGMVVTHLLDDGIGENANDLTGVTERKIELIERSNTYPVGLPLVVTEACLDIATGNELLVGKKINTYDKSGRLLQEDIYGNDGRLALTRSKEYDAHGNVTKEIKEDGSWIVREYDPNDNMILEIGPNPLLSKHFTYDYMNRLIKIEEHHPDTVLSKHFRYDLCGNLIAKVDAMGTETRTYYDDFNRPVMLEGAEISDSEGNLFRPITRYEYNEMSQPTKITSPDGSVTEFAYTLYGKPCKIAYPDGSIERFEYDLEGRLLKAIAKNGSTTLHTYDAQNRIITTIQLTASGEEACQSHSSYSTFRLMEQTDPAGNVTYFTYDSYGRKTSERKGEYVTSYEYDSLNRCCKTIVGSSAKCLVMDCFNRIIEERTENLNGDILALVKYSYDVDGNKIRIEQDSEAGLAIATLNFDTHGIPLESVDPEGNVTHTRLNLNYFNSNGQRVIRTETTDPLGITTVIIKDTQGRPAEQIRLDSLGDEIQRTAYLYDSSGNCIRTIEAVYRGDEEALGVINAWEYNSMNQLVFSIQAVGQPEEKRVTHIYNSYGQLESTIKPDGVSLQYCYDGLGRLVEEKADDHSIHYCYTYDIRSNPIQVDNLLNQSVTSRNYDEHNRITLEKLANGLEMQISYNPDGGLKKVTLPDQSSIDYTYSGPLLTSVERKTPNGATQYRHTYNAYDLSGNPLTASLINNLGELTSRYTLKGQPKERKTPYYSESLNYDPSNHIINKSYQDILGQENNKYAYDSLHQMKEESGHSNHQYTNDSLYNRTSKDGKKYTLNSLNSLLSDGDADYCYDPCGNVTSYTKNNKSYSFSYDALDRLTTLKIDNTSYIYTYDEQNRCIARQEGSTSEKILFLGQCDIGTTDQNGKIKNLRVMGKGIGAEIGAAIAIEIEGEIFAPLHDHQGSVIALIDSNGKTQESYRFSAFGEESIYDADGNEIQDSEIGNPWRFSSKRKEADFNLFGRRFYNPDLGRWLTPDPAGHEAGPNLYAYVSNSPLSHVDHFGLVEEESGWAQFFYNVACFLWQTCKSTAQYSLEKGKEGAAILGQCVKLAIHHCVPIPLVKDCGCMFGYFLETGSLDNYPVSFRTDTSTSFHMDGSGSRNIEFVVINGICNGREDAKVLQSETSAMYEGYNVHLAYNGTDGFVGDILECIANKLGIRTTSVNEAINTIRMSINNVGGPGSDGIVKIDAHSQGGIILNLALQHLTPAEKSMLCVSTYGSGTLIQPHGLKSCVNYVSTRDPIPFIGDTIGYIAATMGLRPEVKFLKPQEGGIEHAIGCQTYRMARIKDSEKFKDKYF